MKVEISPSLPFMVTENGKYNFSLTSTSGSAKTYTVVVNNYKEPTIANKVNVSQYVTYEAKETTYETNSANTGAESQTLKTEKMSNGEFYMQMKIQAKC